jgi:hypothetical protein
MQQENRQFYQERKERYKADEKKQEKDKVDIVGTLSAKLEQNQQKLEEKQEQIREEIKVQVAEINKVKEECDKKFEQLLEKAFSSKSETETSLNNKDTEEAEDELLRRQRERNAELKQPIHINETKAVEETTEDVAEEVAEIAGSTQEKDDATMEVDSCTSVGPAEVSDVIPVSSESATATPKEMPLYQCISLHTITLASITLSDELRLQLL